MIIDLEQESQSIQHDNIILPLEFTKLIIDDYETSELLIQDKKNQIYAKAIHGQSTLYFKSGDSYEGDIFKGMMHGQGVLKWETGIRYEGSFVYNNITGQGEYFWPDGSYYKGELLNGLRHGQGYYESAEKKTTYTGFWVNGQRSGKGKIEFQPGSSYVGEFLNGVKHGKGIFRYASGNYYDGEFKCDKKEGQGTMYWLDSYEKYTGSWENNLQNGFGSHIWLEMKGEKKMLRNRYEGNWLNGERHGFGVFYYANGSKYEGEWKNNLKEGFAIFTEDNGNVIQGTFKADKLAMNILDNPQNSVNLDNTLDITDTLNNSSSIVNLHTHKSNGKKVKKEAQSPLGKNKSIVLQQGVSRQSINNQKTSNLIPAGNANGSPLESINNIPHDVQKQSNFKPNQTSNENGNKDEKSPKGTHKEKKGDHAKNDLLKELQDNPYTTLLDYNDLNINFKDSQSAHLAINTLLLRYNSNLILWFKECSIRFESSLSEITFSMDMLQMWKFLKEIKIFGESLTQASINRLFHCGSKNRYSVYAEESYLEEELQIIKQLKRFVSDEERKDLKLVEFLTAMRRKIKYEKQSQVNIYDIDPNKEKEEISYARIQNIHDPKQPLLYRHFVEILVRTAYLRAKTPDQTHAELELIIEQHVKPWVENRKKNKTITKSQVEEEFSIKANIFKEPLDNILRQLFNKIKTVNKTSKFGQIDETCYLKDIIRILKATDLIKNEQEQNYIYQILENSFDSQLTLGQVDQLIKEREKEREKEQSKANSKRTQQKQAVVRKKTPDFAKIKENRIYKMLNTELIYQEFTKILLMYLIKTIKEGHPRIDDEALEKKTGLFIEKINKKTISKDDSRLKRQAPPKIWPQSIKDVLKVELSKEKLKKLDLEKEKKRKEEEKKREQRERAQMELKDFNVPSDIEDDSFDDY